MSSYPIGGLYEAHGNPIKALLRPGPGRARYRQPVRAYVGLGANLGDRQATIRRAVELVDELDGVAVVGVSSLRETEPWGPVEQPRFLNGAVAVETDLQPRELLEALLDVERRLGRARDDEERWGPRRIDLDLLLYGDLVLDEPGLDVPHPRLHERGFALEPLAELAPDALVPGRGTVAELLRALDTPPQGTGPRADAVH
jgi:2-amino-4-hydroxy-6-hydroxymethyldihydropteridine diphosphokinase